MITSLSISGYKSLRQVAIQPSRINVLVGANACGKSSLIQSLLLLRQSSDARGHVVSLRLSGELFEAGTVRDVLHPEAGGGIDIGINSGVGESFRTHFAYRASSSRESRRMAATSPVKLPPSLFARGSRHFAYLNAERIGPRVVYQLPRAIGPLAGAVGMHGEYATAFLARCFQEGRRARKDWYSTLRAVFDQFPEDLPLDEGSARDLTRLDLVAKQLLAWIIPGVDFATTEQSAIDAAQLAFIRDPGGTKTQLRPTHMGFGVSYCLPLLVAALALGSDSLYLVENPEAHLHPSSQSRIGMFLGLLTRHNTQVFVETHSDHVVNGLRLAVKYGLVEAESVKFFYFTKDIESDSASVEELTVSSDGRLSSWPAGFFDQIEHDLARL